MAVTVWKVTHPQGVHYHTTKNDGEGAALYKFAGWGDVLDPDVHPNAITGLRKGGFIEKVDPRKAK